MLPQRRFLSSLVGQGVGMMTGGWHFQQPGGFFLGQFPHALEIPIDFGMSVAISQADLSPKLICMICFMRGWCSVP